MICTLVTQTPQTSSTEQTKRALAQTYQNGMIYKITDNGYTKCYYGSTINILSKRLDNHKQSYKAWKNNKANKCTVYNLFEEFGIENCKIELVELFPCNSRIELEKKEGEYIRNNDCLNKNIAGRTRLEYQKKYNEANKERLKEYYQDNKEILKNYKKQYYQANKEKIKEYQKQYHQAKKVKK